jgi:hypothetical protein
VLYDRDFDDLHILGAPIFDGDIAAVETDIEELLRTASWVAPSS